MTRAETLKIMTLLSTLTGPAPEGDTWSLTVAAWASVLSDVPEADMLRAVKAYVTGGPGRAPGTWWPKPGELLALLRPAELTDEQAWSQIRPQLAGAVHLEGLTDAQVTAVGSLPSAWDRARMSSADLDRLRGRFLSACQAAEVRAKSGSTATVTAFPAPAERLRLADPLPRLDLSCPNPEPAYVPRAVPASRKPEPIARTIPDEHELRERARAKAAEVMAKRSVGAR